MSRAQGWGSKRIWSLWDMLKRFETEYLLGSLNFISQTERKLRSELEGMKPTSKWNWAQDQAQNTLDCVSNVLRARNDYDLPGLKSAIEETKTFIMGRPSLLLSKDEATQLHSLLFALHSTALNVLDDQSIWILTRGSADYVAGDKTGFGPTVETSFPSSVYDSREASKCLGFERWTASVMHCMRALEPALLALESAVPVAVPKEQWGDKINQIEAAIKRMNKSTHPKSDVQWFSDAATQFHFIKTAWRNYAQHLLHTYDEERASEIYDATRRFMRHLATRLQE